MPRHIGKIAPEGVDGRRLLSLAVGPLLRGMAALCFFGGLFTTLRFLVSRTLRSCRDEFLNGDACVEKHLRRHILALLHHREDEVGS